MSLSELGGGGVLFVCLRCMLDLGQKFKYVFSEADLCHEN